MVVYLHGGGFQKGGNCNNPSHHQPLGMYGTTKHCNRGKQPLLVTQTVLNHMALNTTNEHQNKA